MQIDPRTIKNILAVRNDRFGEFLLNIPALRALKQTFPYAKIITVVNPYVKELAECIPFIDEIIEWEKQKSTLSEKLSLIGALKKRNLDMAIMLNPSKEFNIFTYLAGIPIRVGYARKWGFLLTHKMEDKKYLGQKHEIEYNLELVRLIGANTDDLTLSLKINDDINTGLGAGFDKGNLIAIHPWTSDPIKQWPQRYFHQLAKRITLELDIKVVIIGGKPELAKRVEFSTDIAGSLINMTGKTTLKQLAALLKKCKLLISGDSGPVHLASCVGTPVIAIFRSDMPEKSSVRWGPHSEGSAIIEKSNLSNIMVDEVVAKAREVLAK